MEVKQDYQGQGLSIATLAAQTAVSLARLGDGNVEVDNERLELAVRSSTMTGRLYCKMTQHTYGRIESASEITVCSLSIEFSSPGIDSNVAFSTDSVKKYSDYP